jgi:hypothetical protein
MVAEPAASEEQAHDGSQPAEAAGSEADGEPKKKKTRRGSRGGRRRRKSPAAASSESTPEN